MHGARNTQSHALFLHARTDLSMLAPAPSPSCRVHIDAALPPTHQFPSNPPDEFRNGCGHPHIWCMFPSHSSTSNSKHRQPKKAPAQVLLPGRHEEGKAWETGRVVGRGGDVSFWISHSKFGL